MTDEEFVKRKVEKTAREPLRKFEIKLEIKQTKNILGFIPSIYVFTGNNLCLDAHFKWLFIDFHIWLEWNMHTRKNFNGMYIIPLFFLRYLDKDYKEKFDFQFSWFNMRMRKFFGKRKTYEISIKDKEYKKFWNLTKNEYIYLIKVDNLFLTLKIILKIYEY